MAALLAALVLGLSGCTGGARQLDSSTQPAPTIGSTASSDDTAATHASASDGSAPPSSDGNDNNSDNQAPDFGLSPVPDEAIEAVEWRPCGGGLDCATLAVPVDHDDPYGPRIDLALVRVPAGGTVSGSILVNPGGPGASGVDFVRSGFRLDDETMTNFDLIGFDPRGVGSSSDLSCTIDRAQGPLPDFEPDSAAEQAELEQWARAEAGSCDAEPARLAHQTSIDSARDLDWARRALGDDRLNYYGLSYGSRLGLTYASLFPDRVGLMVLDGIVDPADDLADLLARQAVGFEASFDRMSTDCAADANPAPCPTVGVAEAYDLVLARLENAPEGQVGPTELVFATLLGLYDEVFVPPYLDALSRAVDGDVSGLESLSDLFSQAADVGAYLSVVCIDTPVDRGASAWSELADRLAALGPRFGAGVANEVRACADWPVAPPHPTAPPIPKGLPPIVLVGATGDPATPLAGAEEVADGLDGSRLIIVDSPDHTSYGSSECVRALVATYFNTAIPPDDRTRCD